MLRSVGSGMKLVKNRGCRNAPRLDSGSRRMEPAIINQKVLDGRMAPAALMPAPTPIARSAGPGRLALALGSH